MNRLSHLKQTLLKNIHDNLSYKNIEFVLLDYNSTDGLEDWVKSNAKEFIDQGVLNFYKTSEPTSFHRSHSRNVAMKLGSGDIICNLDADNFLGKDFAYFVNYHFSYSNSIFFCSGKPDGSYGRISVKKKDFFKIRGYDEKMSGWGYEDDDLYKRLENLGKIREVFHHEEFTQFIDHEVEESFSNDKSVLDINSIYVQYNSYTKSNILYLFNNNLFYYGTVTKSKDYETPELVDDWENGDYKFNDNELVLDFKNKNSLDLILNDGRFSLEGENDFVLADEKLESSLKIDFTSLTNKRNYESKEEEIVSNPKEWGSATVVRNFSQQIRI